MKRIAPSGVALDIVAHEFAHGVVAHTAKLGVTGEAGALNEGIADVLGASAEHSLVPGDRNWVIGEQAWLRIQEKKSPGIRNVETPRALAATFRSELVPRASTEALSFEVGAKNDKGHVHDNGVIAGLAFYLMTMGGTNDVMSRAVTSLKPCGVTCEYGPSTPDAGAPATSSDECAGHGDVVLCDDVETYSAVVCKNGGIVGNATCADESSFDADGVLICE